MSHENQHEQFDPTDQQFLDDLGVEAERTLAANDSPILEDKPKSLHDIGFNDDTLRAVAFASQQDAERAKMAIPLEKGRDYDLSRVGYAALSNSVAVQNETARIVDSSSVNDEGDVDDITLTPDARAANIVLHAEASIPGFTHKNDI